MTREELNKVKQAEILNEEKREKRKKGVLLCLKIIIIIISIFSIFYLLNTYIFTKGVIVKEQRVISKKIPNNFSGLNVKNLVKLINSRNSDIVVFTGDLIDSKYKISAKEREKLITELAKIKANIGKYSVYGDEDNDEYTTIIKQANFTLLNNSYDLIYDDANLPIIVIGVSSLLNNSYNIDAAFSYFNEATSNSNLYKIVIFHEPDLTDSILEKNKADLLLAGHSHNGNINLPLIDIGIKYDGAKKYSKEMYQLDGAKLYISSGVGTNGSGIRFLCQPSINFFRLSSN